MSGMTIHVAHTIVSGAKKEKRKSRIEAKRIGLRFRKNTWNRNLTGVIGADKLFRCISVWATQLLPLRSSASVGWPSTCRNKMNTKLNHSTTDAKTIRETSRSCGSFCFSSPCWRCVPPNAGWRLRNRTPLATHGGAAEQHQGRFAQAETNVPWRDCVERENDRVTRKECPKCESLQRFAQTSRGVGNNVAFCGWPFCKSIALGREHSPTRVNLHNASEGPSCFSNRFTWMGTWAIAFSSLIYVSRFFVFKMFCLGWILTKQESAAEALRL